MSIAVEGELSRATLLEIGCGVHAGARVLARRANILSRSAERDVQAGRLEQAATKRRAAETLRRVVKLITDWRFVSSSPDVGTIWRDEPVGLAARMLKTGTDAR